MKPGPKKLQNRRERRVRTEFIESTLLTALSMNGRASLTLLGNMIGINKESTYRRVSILEKKYGVRYLAEIDVEKLGYLKFIILVKFHNQIPNVNEVKEAVLKEPRVQLAMMLTGGEYNILFYALAEDNSNIQEVRYNLVKDKLSGYDAEWYVIPFSETYNFVPLRDDFIDILKDRLLKGHISKRSTSADKSKQILKREFAVLRELNTKGATEFTEIDKKYDFDRGRSQYSYYKLKDDEILKRITLTMQNIPVKYIGIIFMDIINYGKFSKTREKLLKNMIENYKIPLNKYVLIGDIGEPFGLVFFIPVFSDGELEKFRESLSKIKGVKIKSYVSIETLFGELCYRRFDNSYSQQYNILLNEYKVKPLPKINYEEVKKIEKPEVIDLGKKSQ